MAQPEQVSVSSTKVAETRWARWMAWRWAAAAAVIVAAVVVILPRRERQMDYFAPKEKPAARAVQPLPEQKQAQNAVVAEPKKIQPPAAARAKQVPPVPAATKKDAVVATRADKEKSREYPASSSQVQVEAAAGMAGGPLKNEPGQFDRAQAGAARQGAPPALKPEAAAPALPMAKAVPSVNETVEVVAPATETAAQKRAEETQAASAPTRRLERPRIVGGLVSAKGKPARWTISAYGKLLRSANGTEWQQVPVAPGVVFRAVAVVGDDVWAGGSGGALFHSSDGGEHWTRVSVTENDIVRTDFSDARHGMVATPSEAWSTADGGKTWTKQER